MYRLIAAGGLVRPARFRRWLASFALAFAWVVALPFSLWLSAVTWMSLPVYPSLVTLSVICALNLIAILWGAFSWALLSRRAAWTEQMIDDQLRQELVILLQSAYKRQYVGWLVIGTVVFCILAIRTLATGKLSQPGWPTWVGIVELMFVVGTTLELSWTFPGVISRLFSSRKRVGALRLLRLSPANTPGLRFVTDALAFGSSFLLACLVITVVIGFVINLAGADADGVKAGLPALLGIIVLLLVRFAIVPVGQLNWIIVDAKAPVLQELDELIKRPRRGRLLRRDDDAELATEQFAVLSQSDNLPFKSSAILQFVGIGFGAIAAYVVQQLVQALS